MSPALAFWRAARDAPFDLGPDIVRGQQRPHQRHVVRMEDQADGRAFDVQRPPIVAVLAPIGHQRIGVLLALAQRLQVGQGSLHLVQLRRHPRHLGLRCLGLLVLFGRLAGAGLDLRLAPSQASPLGREAFFQLAAAGLEAALFFLGGAEPAMHGLGLRTDFALLLCEQRVQGAARLSHSA